MICQQCQSDNKAGRRFCAECGASLSLDCQACGFTNDEDDKFCGGCGAALAAPSPVAPAPESSSSPQPAEGEAERRHLTIMFCDLVGSTALSGQLDPEDLSSVITDFQDACTSVVNDFGGYVARLMGDGMLVYFGYPVAHEDAQERAVRTGLGIVSKIAELDQRHAATLEVRIGIATGLVVVGELVGEETAAERAVVGETPNLAARLQGLAEPGTVVVSSATARGLKGLFEFEDLGHHEVKGFSEPVHAWRPVRATATTSRFEAYRGGHLTPLVGRHEEITFLAERWSQARTGEGQVVTVSGEAGIGKSRILEAMRSHVVEDGGEAIHFQCSPHHQSSTLYCFFDYLARAAVAGRETEPSSLLDGLDDLVQKSAQDVATVSPLFARHLLVPTGERYPPIQGNADEQRVATLNALAAHVQGLAKNGPLLAVFEDVHWIDPTSLDLLGLLIEQAQWGTVMIIITCRPEFSSPWGAMGTVASLTLNRLGRSHSAGIAKKVTGGRNLPTEVLDHIVARTDGVPLFVEEMTKSILESGVLKETADGFVLEGPLSALAVPETLQDSLMSRLDKLMPVKEVAQIGAVIGREFSNDILCAVSTQSPEEIQTALASLATAELVFRRGWPPNEVYVFKHALVQDATYESLLKEKRRALHARVADVLLTTFSQLVEAEPETVAHHLSRSGDDVKAADYWAIAGRRAAERMAHVEASVHLKTAVQSSGTMIVEDRQKQFDLNFDLARSLRVLGLTDETLEVLARAQSLAETPLELSRVHSLRGNIYFLKGDAEQNMTEQETALGYARDAGSVEDEVKALSGLADAAYMRGRMVTSRDYFVELIDLASTHDLATLAAANVPALTNTTYLTKGPKAALLYGSSVLDSVIDAGQRRAELILRDTLGEIQIDQLEFDAGFEHARLASEICEQIGAQVWLASGLGTMARALWYKGEHETAEEKAREAAEMAVEFSPTLLGPWVLSTRALTASSLGVVDEAVAKSEEIFAGGCVGHNQIWAYRSFIDAYLKFENWEAADKMADRLDAFTATEPLAWGDFFAARGHALARAGRGEVDDDLIKTLHALSATAEETGFLLSKQSIDQALQNLA
jgi:class 3 adenylate cyclase/tetratricopeptide (TPR) repeat protein